MQLTNNNPGHPGFERRLCAMREVQQRLSAAVANGTPPVWEDLMRANLFRMSMEVTLEDLGDSPLVDLYRVVGTLLPLAQRAFDAWEASFDTVANAAQATGGAL
jgi:hypothetical protein